ncbi:MAG: hypothetical protein SFZ24_01505 [Planctomycetota bacterium]|nr:hypothetical protein [Planctomycetota bacterium]
MPDPRLVRPLAVALALMAAAHAASARQDAPPLTPAPAAPAPPLTPAPALPERDEGPRGVDKLIIDADKVRLLLKHPTSSAVLAEAKRLPRIEPRQVLVDPQTGAWYAPEDAADMDEAARAALQPRMIDEDFYYSTRYGSPLVYARVLDVASAAVPEVFIRTRWPGRRIMDFGYGHIGHLRLMAQRGAYVVGVDIDRRLQALYRDVNDQGIIETGVEDATGPRLGRLALVHGSWPSDPQVAAVVAAEAETGFHVITAKNTLKNGYINPERPADERTLVKLGVPPDVFLSEVHGALVPGGLFVIYNISPKLSGPDETYKPWSDGRCPFPRETLEAAGFRVVAFDHDDSETARAIFAALGYPTTNEKGEDDVFALYTIAQRRR